MVAAVDCGGPAGARDWRDGRGWEEQGVSVCCRLGELSQRSPGTRKTTMWLLLLAAASAAVEGRGAGQGGRGRGVCKATVAGRLVLLWLLPPRTSGCEMGRCNHTTPGPRPADAGCQGRCPPPSEISTFLAGPSARPDGRLLTVLDEAVLYGAVRTTRAEDGRELRHLPAFACRRTTAAASCHSCHSCHPWTPPSVRLHRGRPARTSYLLTFCAG